MMLTVTAEDEGIRLDRYLAQTLCDPSRSFLQKLIKQGLVLVNEKPQKASYAVAESDRILLTIPEPVMPDIPSENIPLDICYEDDSLLVVNKPKGMVVHPAPGHYTGTLVNALLYHCQGHLSGINGVLRPGIVHRIDKDTTGLLVVCKTDAAHESLSAQLRVHSITRRYRAIVLGNITQDEGTVSAPIARSRQDRKKMCVDPGGREAITHFRVLKRFGQYTYIECRLETGRTHQIRVHMSYIGHPLLGDSVYGARKCPFDLQGQTLHAMVLGFIHPVSQEYMEFTAPLPDYFSHLLDIL